MGGDTVQASTPCTEVAGAVRPARLNSARASAHWLCLTKRILPACSDWVARREIGRLDRMDKVPSALGAASEVQVGPSGGP